MDGVAMDSDLYVRKDLRTMKGARSIDVMDWDNLGRYCNSTTVRRDVEVKSPNRRGNKMI